jgi:Protein of unknown function (DUF3168)
MIDQTTLLEYQLRIFLLTLPDLVALIGDRIFPAPAPQNAGMPFVTFQRVSTERVYSDDGRSGLAGPTIQIDCWADAPEYAGSYGAAKEIAEAIRLELESFRGMWGPIRIQEVTITSENDLYEGQDRTRRVTVDYRIWHDESRTVTKRRSDHG